ncbi:E3 ubiquitin/ISG15 ligase TRIM25 [Trichomycterus rosablanca]|uniref:E3 ubiquitin/ISG15 ligase TRIM25 n=1 Tax=Trichomycterus rosablanca TaxID=2290929 RepID=UPI002F35DEFB
MVDITDNMALLSLEEDLTCSICLCPFENPVSLNCGHSFCLQCLEESWRDTTSYYCPHCRNHFLTKPELKKNTVLSAVVETFKSKAGASIGASDGEVRVRRDEPKPILCDTCMEVKAVKTCLTCMASYCSEHVRPHQENPVFRAHELREPLADLTEHLCSEHGKLMEFYCPRHERAICSNCLQQTHKDCGFSTPEDVRQKKETELRDKVSTLDRKIEKNQLVISQMTEQQIKLKEIAVVRKRALQTEYQQIREMLQQDERLAMEAVDKDLDTGNSRLNVLIKKFYQNVEKMTSTKAEINNLLARSHSLDFLQAMVEMPSVVNFDPYAPRINLDSKNVIAYHSNIVNLKEHISKNLHESVENRISFFKQDLKTPSSEERRTSTSVSDKQKNDSVNEIPRPCKDAGEHLPNQRGSDFKPPSYGLQNKGPSAGARRKPPREKKDNKDQKFEYKRVPNKGMNPAFSKSMDHLGGILDKGPSIHTVPPVHAVPIDLSVATSNPVKRSDLLQHGRAITFDVKTAHRRVMLSENNTKAAVSDELFSYPDGPARFTVCSQVLCMQSFSRGQHYWEVKMSSNNFCGLGLAYGSIDRKGPSSRLGRNAQSWCVEWFNIKLSAWHNSSETVLPNPNPTRVGIFLDCNNGTAIFYNVSDRAYPFHTFVFPFTEAVYPAFWMFSSGSSISLCKPN